MFARGALPVCAYLPTIHIAMVTIIILVITPSVRAMKTVFHNYIAIVMETVFQNHIIVVEHCFHCYYLGSDDSFVTKLWEGACKLATRNAQT